jgi:quercetin dioxygenase-like cupin family protein
MPKELTMRRVIPVLSGVVLVLSLIALGPSAARAEEGQPLDLPCVTGTTVLPLTQAMPSDAPGDALIMLQLTIAPDSGFAPHKHPGVVTVSVVSGTLEFTHLDNGDMSVMRAATGATPAAAEAVTKGVPVTLNPGDWMVEEGMVHTMLNKGSEPSVVLVSGLVPADQPLVQCVEGTPTS